MRSRSQYTMEYQALPEHPSNMTFRGRYTHADKRLIHLCGMRRLPKNSHIRVLDIGCGVLPFGSPTMHDLWDALVRIKLKPEMVGVDRKVEKIQSSYNIQYQEDVPEEGSFDIVRLLRLWEHLDPLHYERIRQKTLERLREGGCLVVSQVIGFVKLQFDDYEVRGEVGAIKIAQKRNGHFVPIQFLPDTVLPWEKLAGTTEEEALDVYRKFQRSVAAGKIQPKRARCVGAIEAFMRQLRQSSPKVLRHESTFTDIGRFPGRYGEEGSRFSMETVRLAAREAPAFFLRHHP